MAIRGIILLLTGLWLLACAPGSRAGRGPDPSGSGSGPSLDRRDYGLAPPSIWSGLTAPEIRALQDLEKAAAGDPMALLALSVFASGDMRRSEDYAAITARVREFIAGIRQAMEVEKSPWRRGALLHQAMHAAFFKPGGKDRIPAGYAWEQSRLTGIFQDGAYNCVSSSLLYLVLARAFGFEAQGIILPSHTFVQLTMPDGKIVEVETTSPDGYDWVHDEAFYAKRAGSWLRIRGLPASTYRDYRARAIVPPLGLIAYNMSNQHTAPGSMAPDDRGRLAEARAHIDPGSREAQINRLDFHNTEYLHLYKKGEWAALERMFRKISPLWIPLRKRWDKDDVLINHLAWLPYEYATTLQALGRSEEAFPWIDSSLAWARPGAGTGTGRILRANNVSRLILITQAMAEAGRYAEAEGRLLRYPQLIRGEADFRTHLTWIYQEWAMAAWNREDWAQAAGKMEKALEFASREHAKAIQANLSAAYLNWSAGFQNKGDMPKAREILLACVDRVREPEKCRARIRELPGGQRVN